MKYKGIIFDLDGVLCQTDEYHYQAWKQLADRLQIPFDREQNNSLRGVSRMESLNIILANGIRQYSEAEKKMFAAEKNNLYCKQLARMTPDDMPDDVKETLIALRCSGYKLAVGSSSKNAPTIINHLGIASFFDAIVDGNCITRSKPDPEVFLKAAKLLQLNPSDCLVVEDAASGVQAAHAGGFDCAVIGNTARDTSAKWNIIHLNELLSIINR